MFQYLRLCVVGWFRSRILQTQSSRTISFLAIDCINLFLDFGFLFLFFGLHEAQGRMCWWPCCYGSFDSEVWSNHAAWRLQWIQTSIPDLPIYNEYFGIVFIRKKNCVDTICDQNNISWAMCATMCCPKTRGTWPTSFRKTLFTKQNVWQKNATRCLWANRFCNGMP